MRRTAEDTSHDRPEGHRRRGRPAREPADEGSTRLTCRTSRSSSRPSPTGSAVPPTAFASPPRSLLLVLGLLVADVAAGTRGAVEQDLADATSGLPRLLLTLLGWMSGIGVLLLPIGVGADLLVRRRPMQLVQALGAAVVGGILVIVLARPRPVRATVDSSRTC